MVIGNICLVLALPASIYSLLLSVFGAGRNALLHDARKTAHIVTALVSISSVMLIYSFVSDSFNIEYVASYSSRGLPLIYKLTGIWAGLDGSLLFWTWLMVIFTSIVSLTKRDESVSYINAVLQFIVSFFLVMMIFDANPFKEAAVAPADGRGLNPLLQNFFMLVHPPALYVGYVGLSVPFAYVIALLIRKDRVVRGFDPYYGEIRMWTLASWLFLTLGNLLGAAWAYIELGWGGFWAWDPVENAGIMPWFTSCAFLHSLVMQEKRGLLKRWNIALVIASFLLTIFGTFITRSGIIQSVHSFSNVTIGIYFIVFMALVVIFSGYLLISRMREYPASERLESLISREGSFYINNLLLIFILVAIVWGTVLPLFSEWFAGRKMEVGPQFFNRITAPLGILLLLLTGIGPEMSWRRKAKGLFRREFLRPAVSALAAGVIVFALGVRKWFPLLASAGSVFVIVTVLEEFIRGGLVTAMEYKTGRFSAVFSLIRRMPKRYGGYIVHLGIAVLFIGIAGSSYKSEYNFVLSKGASGTIAGYDFRLNGLDWKRGIESEGVAADVILSKTGKRLAVLRPALFIHRDQPKPTAEVDLYIRPLKDVYLVLVGISKDEREAEFALTITPLISLVWLGGILMIIGAFLAVLPPAERMAKRLADEEDEMDIALKRGAEEDFA